MTVDVLRAIGFEPYTSWRLDMALQLDGERRLTFRTADGLVCVENDANEYVPLYGVKTADDVRTLLRLMGEKTA